MFELIVFTLEEGQAFDTIDANRGSGSTILKTNNVMQADCAFTKRVKVCRQLDANHALLLKHNGNTRRFYSPVNG